MAEKVTIFSWHTSTREMKAIKNAGFKHNQVLHDTDEFGVARSLFLNGVNVVILRGAHGEIMVGASDDIFKPI